MYPETDEPLVKITKEMLASVKLPMTPEERKKDLEKMGLGAELANQLIHSRILDDFLKLSKGLKNTKASVVASTLLAAPDGLDVTPALKLVDSGKVAKESIEVLVEGMKSGKPAESVAAEKGLFMMGESELKKKISAIVSANKGANAGALMGKAMAELRGKADAQAVRKLIEEALK
jgi:glutamyl-tRNA(Gln) amidotransferase subunit E